VELGRARSPEQTRIDARLTGPKKPIDTVPLTNAEQKFLDEYTGGSSREPENIYANEVGSGSLSAADIAEINRGQSTNNVPAAAPKVQSSAALKSDPMKNLMFRDLSPAAVRAIQRTPSAAMQQREMNLNKLLETAAQTPGGNMPLSTARLPLGQGGGSMVAAVKDKSGRIIGINPIPGAEGSAQPLVPARVLQGPNQASATETIQEYGLTPAQLQAVANTTMSRARQKNAAMNLAKQNLAAKQMELLDQIPQGKYAPSPLSSVIDYNLENVSPEGRDFIRMLQGRSALRKANARAILPNALHPYSPAIADSKGDSYSNMRNTQLNLPI
jgi:hypothetical protein